MEAVLSVLAALMFSQSKKEIDVTFGKQNANQKVPEDVLKAQPRAVTCLGSHLQTQPVQFLPATHEKGEESNGNELE
jgi:hypothetical protein